jgi:hypothetical protein
MLVALVYVSLALRRRFRDTTYTTAAAQTDRSTP